MSDDPEGSDHGRVLRVVHHHPGRVRTRADVFEDDVELGERVCLSLGDMPGVRDVRHSERTGSVLVEYEPGVADPNALLARIVDVAGLEGVVDDANGDLDRRNYREAVLDGGRRLDDALLDISEGRTDLRGLVSAALAAGSVYSLLFNKHEARLPRWDNLLYWSYTILTVDRRPARVRR